MKTEPRLYQGFLRRLVYDVNITTAVIAGVGITVLVLLTGAEVAKRYLLNAPSGWVLEISEYLMVFGAFLGMAYAMQVGAHVAVDVIYLRYSDQKKRIADLVVAVLSLFFWALLTWSALRQFFLYLARDTKSPTVLAVPLAYPMVLVFVGSLICCFQGLLMSYDAVRALGVGSGVVRHPDQPKEERG